ncbi:MAG: SRPBCC family protein [Acidobacteria bacterium]|nr:SRPBCC family protein [Acidobacteriota bacterium]
MNRMTLTAKGDNEILVTRVFNAPRRFVFEAFTKPELIRRWLFGPPGWSMVVCETELRVDAPYRYVWRHEDGRQMGMSGKLVEFVMDEKLVSTEKFDEPWYPGEAMSTVLLEETNGVTTLTQTIIYESKEIRDAVMKTPMEQGMAMGYDRLEELVASMV